MSARSAEARRPLLLGEAPSPQGDRYYMFPLSGPPAKVLCEVAKIPPDGDSTGWGKWTWALYEHFQCRNLIERYGDAYPWSVKRARAAWQGYQLKAPRPLVVVALGRRVSAALGLKVDFGEWVTIGELHMVGAPHPSGRSRIMNDPKTRDLLGRVLNEAKERARA